MRDQQDRSADRRLNIKQIAAKLGVKPKTVTGYRARPSKWNPFPEPIPFEEDDARHRRQPEFWESDIDEWIRHRPGMGTRSDLADPDQTS